MAFIGLIPKANSTFLTENMPILVFAMLPILELALRFSRESKSFAVTFLRPVVSPVLTHCSILILRTNPSLKLPHSLPTQKRASMMMSNSVFVTIYQNFFIKRVSASRMINSDASGRGAISELMISNVVNV